LKALFRAGLVDNPIGSAYKDLLTYSTHETSRPVSTHTARCPVGAEGEAKEPGERHPSPIKSEV
jgi:hypothetical protein